MDALKTLKLAQKINKKILGVVVNRVKSVDHELASEEIERMLLAPVVAEIPEDKNISKSIAAKSPIIDYSPESPAAVEIKRLAYTLTGIPFERHKRRPFWKRLFDWFG